MKSEKIIEILKGRRKIAMQQRDEIHIDNLKEELKKHIKDWDTIKHILYIVENKKRWSYYLGRIYMVRDVLLQIGEE